MKGDNFYGRESSKEEKENKVKDKEKEEDMFTKLPKEIILHILSFLDAKIAVQTSVLNKRFRYLWAALPVINFDEALYQDAISFEDFVYSFLFYRYNSTNVFNVNLKCHKDHLPILRDNAVVYYIIYHVIDTPSIATNIQELYIDVGWLPKDICSLYTLIELFEIMQRAKSISLSSKIIDVLSMFPDELEDKCSPFTRMQTFELICDSSSSSAMPQDVKKYLFGEDNSSFTP
ncbi:putative F-box protein At1g58310 isoform X3 [Vigna radiata var. radiata]|uniref:F-box protein At1g58310 isoform X3 n=1 Tax=Vigna radiata var. radiata TaxID=3916 RepID=A0A3Q0F233_VIGRR|nr:putative F-box protein At1g58310 isoform X3 [Vigna radiata var. radiata]